MIKLNLSYLNEIDFDLINIKYEKRLNEIHKYFLDIKDEMMGWVNWPNIEFMNTEYKYLYELKDKWNKLGINHVVIIGIGGSYIGIKAAIDMLSNSDIKYTFLSQISSFDLEKLQYKVENDNWGIVVISKSGGTLETTINFRFARDLLHKKYQDKHNERIIAVTSKNKGKLIKIAKNNHYYTLTINNDIGGRYSSLTSFGLFLMLYKGVNIEKVLQGSKNIQKYFLDNKYNNNDILKYIATRDWMIKELDLNIEIFQLYDDKYKFIGETYKQLFAESEGKKDKIILPVISIFSNDLHSIGQLYQQGYKKFFQTTMYIEDNINIKIPVSLFDNDDGIDYLVDKNISVIKNSLKNSVLEAHSCDAKNKNILIEVTGNDEIMFGEIYSWLSFAAACSSYLNNLNPFDQPGVENYKNKLKKIL